MKDAEHLKSREQRSEIREFAAQGAVVEFRPGRDAMTYQVALRDWSQSGLGILVKKNSKICQLLEVGHIFPMAVYNGEHRDQVEHVTAEVRHISEPLAGQHPDHCIIGLLIHERLPQKRQQNGEQA